MGSCSGVLPRGSDLPCCTSANRPDSNRKSRSRINSYMKTITSPASTARDQRDVLIARVIRHRARIQRKVERMQAADEPGKGQQAKPASGRAGRCRAECDPPPALVSGVARGQGRGGGVEWGKER